MKNTTSKKQSSATVNTRKGVFWTLVESAPVSIPAAVSMYGIAVMMLLVLGRLSSIFAVTALVAIVPPTIWFVSKKARSLVVTNTTDRYVILAVLIGVFGWALFNSQFAAQNIFIYRDPAIYTNNGAWLAENEDIEIVASNVFGDSDLIKGNGVSLGPIKGQDSERLYVHGGQLLPAFLGLFTRITSEEASFKLNSFIGGLALLSFFGLSRLYVRTTWAAIATAFLALLLPMMYFSRDNYTEPLSLLFVFAGLSLTQFALGSKDKAVWALAGLSVGAITLTRIDAYLIVAAFILAVLMWATIGLGSASKKSISVHMLGYFAAVTAASTLGWIAYTQLGGKYYSDLRKGFIQQIVLIAAIGAVGALVYLVSFKKGLLRTVDSWTRRWRFSILAGVVVLGTVWLAARPLWMTGYWSKPNPLVSLLLGLEGDPIVPRSFGEHSLDWVWWYIGPVIALMGLFGYLLLVKKVLSSKKYLEYGVLLSVFTITFCIYVIKPSITPDQVWASRRYLPVVFPALCLFSVVGFQYLSDRYLRRCRAVILSWPLAAAIAFPLFVAQPFITTRTFENEYAHVQQVCGALPENAAVLFAGNNGFNMMQAVRTYCDVPTERFTEPTAEGLVPAYAAAVAGGYEPFLFIHDDDLPVLPAGSQTSVVSDGLVTDLQRNLYHPPRITITESRKIHLAEITEDGRIISLQ